MRTLLLFLKAFGPMGAYLWARCALPVGANAPVKVSANDAAWVAVVVYRRGERSWYLEVQDGSTSSPDVAFILSGRISKGLV